MTARALVAPVTGWMSRRRVLVGLARLCGILFGVKATNSHEVATHNLMVIGFLIEGYILTQVWLDRFLLDFPGFTKVQGLLALLMAVVTFFLLFHQFVIFRNFAVPRESATRDKMKRVSAVIDETIASLSSGGSPAEAVEKLGAIAVVGEAVEDDQTLKRRAKRALELAVYALFGVLTGEAGYMLTVLHEHDQSNWSARLMWSIFATKGMRWGQTLECTFLFCAMAICLCVVIWDIVVWRSPIARDQYGPLLGTFFWNDVMSFLFWLCLFAVVTPSARFMLGARLGAEDSPELGRCTYLWGFLVLCSSLYLYKTGSRFVDGLKTLGGAPSYVAARFEII